MVDSNGNFETSDLQAQKQQMLAGKKVKHGDKEVESHSVDEAIKLANWIKSETGQGRSVSVAFPILDASYF